MGFIEYNRPSCNRLVEVDYIVDSHDHERHRQSGKCFSRNCLMRMLQSQLEVN